MHINGLHLKAYAWSLRFLIMPCRPNYLVHHEENSGSWRNVLKEIPKNITKCIFLTITSIQWHFSKYFCKCTTSYHHIIWNISTSVILKFHCLKVGLTGLYWMCFLHYSNNNLLHMNSFVYYVKRHVIKCISIKSPGMQIVFHSILWKRLTGAKHVEICKVISGGKLGIYCCWNSNESLPNRYKTRL